VTPTQLRDLLHQRADQVAPHLLGCLVTANGVTIRLTEVEAYAGEGGDPASHAHRGPTRRNASQFGPSGHAYVYFTYGMHYCLNVVCRPEGIGGGVLLRAGEVVDGIDLARERRPGASDRDLARGPARLTVALAVDRSCDGVALFSGGPISLRPGEPPAAAVRTGPRTGVSTAADTPWRFWLDADPTVSPYRKHAPKNRSRTRRGHASESKA
jgi:DNA-3-methyladenine glycosylase